ncbi:PlsC domain-containing protein [Meloidogyne graminicola]|uniref:PlsC domain-containing protein n=1 Tax=Meloidogyne graminicola TaxID=189291 RepID=A0A8S9ZEB8_9BILA|nr:PlsC domain-containing protein [Meloidogyne graminicola]
MLYLNNILIKNVDISIYHKNLREICQNITFKIVSDQNNNNVLNLWPFMALAILQIRHRNHKCQKISLKELLPIVQMLVTIYNKCLKGKEICRKGLTLYEDILYFLHFYERYINFDANSNTLELKDMNSVDLNECLKFPTIILLSNYSSIAIYSLAQFCIFAISENNTNINLSTYEKYRFLFQLLNKEFFFDSSEMSKQFEHVKKTYELLNKTECHLLAHIIMPYLIGYYNIFEILLENNGEKFRTQPEFLKTIFRKLILRIKVETNKLPLQIASIDLVKNVFNFLKSKELIQENNHFIINFVEITRIWRLLGELLNIDFQEFISETLNSKFVTP